jgi:sigma-E factor negative regulatory protein RseA
MGLSDLEKVAALADGNLSDADAQAVLDLLIHSTELRDYWDELHAVGDALRSEELIGTSDEFVARFASRLAAEPTVLASRNLRANRPWLRYGFPGLAAAAAIAMVAWIAAPQFSGAPIGAPAQVARVEPRAPVAAVVEQVALRASPVDPKQLNEYLAAHQQFSVTALHGPGYIQSASLETVRVPTEQEKQ